MVAYYVTFHTVEVLEKCGPFPACNMLDIERFHTAFKKLARGTNIMASIQNNHEMLEVT